MMRTLSLLLLAATLAGCAAAPKPKYTIGFEKEAPIIVGASDISLRMAEDLRAYNNPLIFNADGTVVPCKTLNYYAPLEVLLASTLRQATTFTLQKGIFPITVQAFHADLRGPTPIARVTLENPTTHATVTRTADLPEGWTAQDLRLALAKLLRETYLDLIAK